MPYDWTVNFAKNLLLSGPVAFGEQHVKVGSNTPRDKVVQLFQTGVVRFFFMEYVDFQIGASPADTLGAYLRACAANGVMDATWPQKRLLFANRFYQGPGPAFIEAAVAARVPIYLADHDVADGGSDAGVRERDQLWGAVFDAVVGDSARGAVILIGAEHFQDFPGTPGQPIHVHCRIPLTRVFDLSTGERLNVGAAVPRHRPFPTRKVLGELDGMNAYAKIWEEAASSTAD